MKKLLILIVAMALYFHYNPNPQLNAWLKTQKESVLAYFSDATDTRVKLKAEKIYQDLSNDFAQFNEQELNYLKIMTSSRGRIEVFFTQYCKTGTQSLEFHRDNQAKVCKAIEQYSNFF